MSDIQITTYSEPRWGSKATGSALIHKDRQARYYVDSVGVVEVQTVDLFTVLSCDNGTTYNVLTAILRQVDRQADVVQPDE
jgi:hypothetical protein